MTTVVRDPLHVASLVLTCIAAILYVFGNFLPNWWMLLDREHNVVQQFTLFGDVVCGADGCFAKSSSFALTMKEGDLTSWLSTIKIMGIIGMALVFLALLIQLIFLAKPVNKISFAAIAVLMVAGLIGFLNGFLMISKYEVLTYLYISDRPEGSLVYNAGASALVLIAFILCIVAAVATGYGLRRPTPKAVYNV